MARPSFRPSSTPRVAVIGAGVIGLSCALRLKQGGAEVSVYDQGTNLGSGASQRSAGMLSAAFESALDRENRAMVAFAQHASRLWPEFAAEVERLGNGAVEHQKQGSLVCAVDAAEEGHLKELATACQARDIPAEWLSTAKARAIEPSLIGPLRAALFLPEDTQVDAPLLLQRLGSALQRIGVGLKLGRMVERVGVQPGGFLLPDNERFDAVLLASGAGQAAKFIDRFGDMNDPGIGPIVPVKGQMLAVAPGGVSHVIRLKDVYIAPKARWTLIGASVERGKTDTEVDRAVIERLRRAAAAVVGSLGDAPELSAWAGVRPSTPDDAPMIGRTGLKGVHAALGCYRNGILFAPAVAELVARQLLDGKVSPEAEAFSPLRFDNARQH